jgi:hypothetical protein
MDKLFCFGCDPGDWPNIVAKGLKRQLMQSPSSTNKEVWEHVQDYFFNEKLSKDIVLIQWTYLEDQSSECITATNLWIHHTNLMLNKAGVETYNIFVRSGFPRALFNDVQFLDCRRDECSEQQHGQNVLAEIKKSKETLTMFLNSSIMEQ